MNKISTKLLSIIILGSLLLTPFAHCSSLSWKEKIKDFITAKQTLTITMGCLIGFGLISYKIKAKRNKERQKLAKKQAKLVQTYIADPDSQAQAALNNYKKKRRGF